MEQSCPESHSQRSSRKFPTDCANIDLKLFQFQTSKAVCFFAEHRRKSYQLTVAFLVFHALES